MHIMIRRRFLGMDPSFWNLNVMDWLPLAAATSSVWGMIVFSLTTTLLSII